VHGPYPLPLVGVGGWGAGKGHAHYITAEHTPLGNMWVTIGDQDGTPGHVYGESTGRVSLS